MVNGYKKKIKNSNFQSYKVRKKIKLIIKYTFTPMNYLQSFLLMGLKESGAIFYRILFLRLTYLLLAFMSKII